MSNDCCESFYYEIRTITTGHRPPPFTYLLHFKNKFINGSCFRGEFPSITDRHGTSDVRSVAVPLTASIDQKDLRVELFRTSMSQIVLVMVIMWLDRSPSKFAIVAAIMKS